MEIQFGVVIEMNLTISKYMKYAFVFLLICKSSFASDRFNIDGNGKQIKPAKISKDLERRLVRLGKIEIGEKVIASADAMLVDDNGNCWLNPKYIVGQEKNNDLEITRNKLGYIVRVNFHYHQTVSGYKVPYTPKWERKYVPPNYIPVKSLIVESPHSEESPSYKITKKLNRKYDPMFSKPETFSNPYSEKNNERFNSRTGAVPDAIDKLIAD